MSCFFAEGQNHSEENSLEDGWSLNLFQYSIRNIHLTVGAGASLPLNENISQSSIIEVLFNRKYSCAGQGSFGYKEETDTSNIFNMHFHFEVKIFTGKKKDYSGFYLGPAYGFFGNDYEKRTPDYSYRLEYHKFGSTAGLICGYRKYLNKRWMLDVSGGASIGWIEENRIDVVVNDSAPESESPFFDGRINFHIGYLFPKFR
jgi:hypothetical protein